jgi:hypothetical protein
VFLRKHRLQDVRLQKHNSGSIGGKSVSEKAKVVYIFVRKHRWGEFW